MVVEAAAADVTTAAEAKMAAVEVEETSAVQQGGATAPGGVATPSEGGKKSLLELLSAMKVDVTTKRKVRAPRPPALSQPPTRSKAPPTAPVAMETTKEMFQEASAAAATATEEESLSPELVAAASAAASTLPNRHQATSELLRQLRHHEAQTHTQQPGGEALSNLIADMKVGKRAVGRQDAWSTNQIRFDEDGRGFTQERGIRKSNFGGKRLNVFTEKTEYTPAAEGLSLWDVDLAHRITMATNQLPRNGFEEMLLWTRRDQVWQYPINNEAGLEAELSVPFHEHVFLERHLEAGFPTSGPIRHFMELVITGLAKNHTLTANQKQEHIAWFRNYFQEKKAVLEEAEAFGS
ncbi:28S ribosomal protein S31, mitochondrial [Engraulis encrasicolus]|uniref:28S ribosomal protein S31, mitochondrial n=1 Tax=Engraulis encrasicolus TaxID=184585 RepID=UPI002FCF9557